VFDGNGVQLHRYLHGPAVDQILADETSTSVNWALVDNLGSVRDIIDSEGVLLNHVTYDSFGQVTSELNPDVDFRFGYTGRERDEETGLYYYRARYYDAAIGEFVSEDPIGFNGGDLNLSRYVFNNPVNNIDPSGKTSAELTALLSVFSHPRTPGSSIYLYETIFQYHSAALLVATNWYYIITEPETRESKTIQNPLIQWVASGKLKGGLGRGALRPGGTSGANPTIDLQVDKDSKPPTRHQTLGHENATEIKFRVDNVDKFCPILTPIPILRPSKEPRLDPMPVLIPVEPQPRPQPEPQPNPAPGPWVPPVPAIPNPLPALYNVCKVLGFCSQY
jgi:RHS repeat-associated protein